MSSVDTLHNLMLITNGQICISFAPKTELPEGLEEATVCVERLSAGHEVSKEGIKDI